MINVKGDSIKYTFLFHNKKENWQTQSLTNHNHTQLFVLAFTLLSNMLYVFQCNNKNKIQGRRAHSSTKLLHLPFGSVCLDCCESCQMVWTKWD